MNGPTPLEVKLEILQHLGTILLLCRKIEACGWVLDGFGESRLRSSEVEALYDKAAELFRNSSEIWI